MMIESKAKDRPMNSFLPSIMEEKKGHLLSTDILSKLVDERIVFVTGEVNADMATVVIAQLLYLDSIDNSKEIFAPAGVV